MMIDLISTLQLDLLNKICEDLELNNTGCDIGLEDFRRSLKLQILKKNTFQIRFQEKLKNGQITLKRTWFLTYAWKKTL